MIRVHVKFYGLETSMRIDEEAIDYRPSSDKASSSILPQLIAVEAARKFFDWYGGEMWRAVKEAYDNGECGSKYARAFPIYATLENSKRNYRFFIARSQIED